MNKKLEVAVKLLDKNDDAKLFQGLCLILEVAEEHPEDLDPVLRALINPVIRRVVNSTENSLGVPAFDREPA
jgi:hypothetical protein